MGVLPPTVNASLNSIHTKSYYSQIPEMIASGNAESPIILGVDEAGRGPVMGPMVYGISYCTREYQDTVLIPKYEFDDSKKLTDVVRRDLFMRMYDTTEDGTGSIEINGVGYATTSITPVDISSGMLKFPPSQNYNLNEQAHDVTMALIDGVIKRGVKLDHVYVDTVGPPITYQKKLETRFPNVKFTVAKKADSLYCVVSVASVVAKVTRDILIEQLKRSPDEIMGSGYPSDPKTTAWLRDNQKQLFAWPQNIVRFSWQTCHTLVNDDKYRIGSVPIEWEEDYISSKKNMSKQWVEPNPNNAITLDNWFA